MGLEPRPASGFATRRGRSWFRGRGCHIASARDVAFRSTRAGFCLCRLVTTSRATPLLKGVCSRDGMSPGMLRVLSPATAGVGCGGGFVAAGAFVCPDLFRTCVRYGLRPAKLGRVFLCTQPVKRKLSESDSQNCSRPKWGSVLSNCRTVLHRLGA